MDPFISPVGKRISTGRKAIAKQDPVELRDNLTDFLEKVLKKGYLSDEQKDLFQNGIDGAKKASSLTEIHGEIVLAHFISKYGGEALYEWSQGTGIDGLSDITREFKGELVRGSNFSRADQKDFEKYIGGRSLCVFEAKGPGAQLGRADGKGHQMSAQWVGESLRGNKKAWEAVKRLRGGAKLPTIRDAISINTRIKWVRGNTLPVLITANPLGKRMSKWLGTCEVLEYRDLDWNDSDMYPVSRFTFLFD